MEINVIYPLASDTLFLALGSASKKTFDSTSKQLTHAKHGVRVVEAALSALGYDISAFVEVIVGVKRVYTFPSLVGKVRAVDRKFTARGRFNRTIYVMKVGKGLLSCGRLVSSTGIPLFTEVFSYSKDLTVPVSLVGVKIGVELSVGSAISCLSVTTTVVSIFRDLNKVYEGCYAEKHLQNGTGLLVVTQYSVHLIKCSLKITQVAILILGVSTPLTSVTLVVATLGVGFVYDMVRTEDVKTYFLGIPLLTYPARHEITAN